MVCGSCVRSLVVQAGTFANRVKINGFGRSLRVVRGFSYWPIREYKTFPGMMVDTGSMSRAGPLVDMMPEKDDDGRFASGGWKRWIWFSQLASNLCWRLEKGIYLLFHRWNLYFAALVLSLTSPLAVGVKRL